MSVGLPLRRRERVLLLSDSMFGNGGVGSSAAAIVTLLGPDDSTPENSLGRAMRSRYASGGHAGDAPAFVNAANPGFTTADLVTVLTTQAYAANPTACILMIGTNDVLQNKDLVTFTRPALTSIFAGLVANCPRLNPGRLFALSHWVHGDDWPDGAGGLDARINAYNAELFTRAAAVGAQYLDIRTPTLAVLPSLNPGHLASNVLTGNLDLIHPKRMGARYVISFIMAALSFDLKSVAT